MKISSKARYGIKALLDLAVHAKHDHVSLKAIAERQQISDRYLEQVFSLLKKSGLVKSVKGPQGGYVLGCDPVQTTAYDIICALEGNEIFEEVYDPNDFAQAAINEVLWHQLDSQVRETLMAITLGMMVDQYQRSLTPKDNMYFI